MIQDIQPKRFHNEFLPQMKADENSIICSFHEGQMLVVQDVQDNDELRFPKARELKKFGIALEKCTYLFSIDDGGLVSDHTDHYFLYQHHLSREMEEYGSYRYLPIRKLGHLFRDKKDLALATYTAKQLSGWYKDNRFCGTCGAGTEHANDERAIVCPKCGRRIYPRILPAVIVGVTNGDKLLMTKYAGRGYNNYALVAGFTEIGESLEQTVAREVMEEVGMEVTNIRYYKSQPWGIVDDLLAGFYCDVVGDTSIHIDPDELKEALWMDREEIEGLPNDLSLTNEMMMTFKAGKEPV